MEPIIASKDNEKIKWLRKLATKKFREDSGQFLVENIKIIGDALHAGILPEALFISDNLLAKHDSRLADILRQIPVYFVFAAKINSGFSSLDTPSGICAVYQKPFRPIDLKASVLYLNGISDPGNLGTILRTALAFGFQNIVVDDTCADIFNPKTIQSAKDALFKLNIHLDRDYIVFEKVKSLMPILSAAALGGKNIQTIHVAKPFCVVFGNEAHGISKKIQALTDTFITIPMSPQMESLNVAVAAGIILHALT